MADLYLSKWPQTTGSHTSETTGSSGSSNGTPSKNMLLCLQKYNFTVHYRQRQGDVPCWHTIEGLPPPPKEGHHSLRSPAGGPRVQARNCQHDGLPANFVTPTTWNSARDSKRHVIAKPDDSDSKWMARHHSELPPCVASNFHIRDKLSVQNSILFHGSRCIIPPEPEPPDPIKNTQLTPQNGRLPPSRSWGHLLARHDSGAERQDNNAWSMPEAWFHKQLERDANASQCAHVSVAQGRHRPVCNQWQELHDNSWLLQQLLGDRCPWEGHISKHCHQGAQSPPRKIRLPWNSGQRWWPTGRIGWVCRILKTVGLWTCHIKPRQ